MRDQSRGRRAALAASAECAPQRALDDQIEVGVVHQRHEEIAEARVGDVRERARHLAPRRRRGIARVSAQPLKRCVSGLHICFIRAGGQRDRGGHHNARIRILQVRPHQADRLPAADCRNGTHRSRADGGVLVGQQPLDRRQPLLGQPRPDRLERPERARANHGRRVVQEQRCDQVPLFERFQQVHGIDDAPFVGMGQLFDERLDRLQVRLRAADVSRRDLAMLDAAAERGQILATGPKGHDDPDRHQRQARDAEALPVEAQTPRLDEHQDQQRAHRLRKPVHGHVDERLRAVFDVGRQRQEQDLPCGLVNRVAKRRVEHPSQRRRPERTVEQHHNARDAEAHRQNHQREAEAEEPVDATGQAHLDHEANQ